ncbi:hypothetical protein HMPREF0346_2391, partial [Enterococcus faecalis EnGen0297]
PLFFEKTRKKQKTRSFYLRVFHFFQNNCKEKKYILYKTKKYSNFFHIERTPILKL